MHQWDSTDNLGKLDKCPGYSLSDVFDVHKQGKTGIQQLQGRPHQRTEQLQHWNSNKEQIDKSQVSGRVYIRKKNLNGQRVENRGRLMLEFGNEV